MSCYCAEGWLKTSVTLLNCFMIFTLHVTGSFGMLSSRPACFVGSNNRVVVES